MEPALTNIGIVLPSDGYSAAVREITRRHGVLLVIDETHTMCAGPGGCTSAWGLEPDLLVVGKAIGGGIPCAAYGMTAEVAGQLSGPMLGHEIDVAGVGGTLTGSALALGAIRATLSHGAARRGLRGRRAPGRAVHRGRSRGDRGARAALARAAAGLPRGVLVLPATARRRRRGRRRGRGARGVPAPVVPQPRRAADAVPQHGAVLPGAHRGRRGPAHRGLRPGARRAGGTTWRWTSESPPPARTTS